MVSLPAYKDERNNDTWYANFYYTDWDGVRKRKKKRGFKLKREALDFEREFLDKYARSPDMTFESLVDIYNDDMQGRLRETTRQSKAWIMQRHIMPFFGNLKVSEITPPHVRKWQSELMKSDKKYAPTYLRSMHNQLTAVFNYAVKFYKLPANPCHDAGSMGKKKAGTMKFWTLDEFESFIVAVKRLPARVGFILLYWSGIRIGELLALTENDFDFMRGAVYITEQYQRVEGEDIVDETKTEKGTRTIPLPLSVLKTIKDYIPRLYDYEPGDRLFPYTRSYFYSARDKACAVSGVKKIRLHDIRHSHVALLIDMRVPILLISERLGHKDIQTTLGDYGHLYPNLHDDTVERLDELMNRSLPEMPGS